MDNYSYYANMNKEEKNRLGNTESIQQNCDQSRSFTTTKTNYSNNIRNNNKSTLKRTESKMDENANESDDNRGIDSEVDDSNWQQQNRRNKRANKTPRTDYFVHGRTITSSSHGYSRMEKSTTRHPSPQHTERTK